MTDERRAVHEPLRGLTVAADGALTCRAAARWLTLLGARSAPADIADVRFTFDDGTAAAASGPGLHVRVTAPAELLGRGERALAEGLWARSGLASITWEEVDGRRGATCLPTTSLPQELAGAAAALVAAAWAVPGGGRRRPGVVVEVDALETLTLLPMQPLAAVQLPSVGASRTVGAVGGRLGGTLASRDGEVYVRLVEPVQWSRLLAAIAPIAHLAPDAVRDPTSLDREAATINPALAAWIAARTTDEVLEEGRRLQIPVAPFVDPARLPADTHLVARGYADGERADLRAPWIVDRTVVRATPSRRALHPTATQPLHGLRVLDLSWAWAGPFATTLLAELGADVINIEWLPRPSNFRVQAPAVDEFGTSGSGWWSANQRGKRSVALDLKDEAALGAVLDLAAHCDIAIENFSAGVADRLGLGFDALVARNPDVVYLSMSAYGATGPRRSERGYGTQLFASAGYSRMLRGPTGAMSQMGIPLPDPISGLVAAIGLVGHLGGNDAVHLDASELEATVAARGVALDPAEQQTSPAIQTFADVLDDDYLRRRGAWMVDDNAAFAGRGVRIARAPWRIGGQRPPAPSPAPILGADTVAVLRDVSGWDAASIEALVSSGAALAAAPTPMP